jgi:DNA repair exonuclease SbcCD ATPase subunit
MNQDLGAVSGNQQPYGLDALESALAEKHGDLAQVAADLRQLNEEFCERARVNLATLVEENEGLRRLLAEKEANSGTVADANPLDLDAVQEFEKLRAENQRLRRGLEEKEELLDGLRREAEAPREAVDLESFEAELNRYRQQLESDRQKVNAELQHLRTRNEELDEATREMEMEFSRERAELARERTKLERLREEVRAELERMQRDVPMRESMMSVHRLRESITQHK